MNLTVRALADRDWGAVRRIYATGIATGNATFETTVPEVDVLAGFWQHVESLRDEHPLAGAIDRRSR